MPPAVSRYNRQMFARHVPPAVATGLLLTLVLLPQDQKPSADRKKKGLPLKPERKVEFITDEGTWLSLDVAPDGRQIIFELLGDIYMLPIEGGEAKPLLTGMAFESQPRYSPDGKRIAFLSDREGAENLWIANPDGSDPKQLSKEQHTDFASPSWTPDGEYVLVSRASPTSRTNEVWMYSVRGGSGVQVTKATTGPVPAGPTPSTTPRMNVLGQWPHPMGASSITRVAPARSVTTPLFRYGRSCGATASPATRT